MMESLNALEFCYEVAYLLAIGIAVDALFAIQRREHLRNE
jgi:hypothetical protein